MGDGDNDDDYDYDNNVDDDNDDFVVGLRMQNTVLLSSG